MNIKELQTIEQTPEVRERVEFLRAQIERGIDFETCIGLHGTSIYGLYEAVRTGYFTGNTPFVDDFTDPETRDFYFHPLLRHRDMIPVEIDWIPEEESLAQVKTYAVGAAFAHAFLSSLELPIDDPEHERPWMAKRMYHYRTLEESIENVKKWYGPDFEKHKDHIIETLQGEIEEEEEPIKYFESLGIDKARLLQERDKAFRYNGLIIGIHPQALQDLILLPGDYREGDVRFRATGGIDIKYMMGCQILGPKEKQIIKKW